MKGFFNALLRIDLSGKRFCREDISDDVLRESLGGKGLGIHLLMTENPTGVDPLSAENRFILATGPATGTGLWGHSRFGAYSKSPATGGFAESYCGGTLAPRIKGCGIDAVILEGRCDALDGSGDRREGRHLSWRGTSERTGYRRDGGSHPEGRAARLRCDDHRTRG